MLNHIQLLDSLTTAIVVVDQTLRVIQLNPAAEQLLENGRAQIVGKPITHCINESQAALSALQQAARHGHTYTKRQARWQLPTGRQLTIDYTVTPVDEPPNTRALLLEIQDLDRLLRISREESLLATQETTRHLVRSLAHEIKNPLGGIRGAAQLLARQLNTAFDHHPSALELREYTDVMIEEADRLHNLVDRMLGPRQPMRWEPLNIHQVVERVAAIISAEWAGDISIRRDYDPSLPPVPGDKELLIQALLNIARNALQALSEPSPTPEASLTLQTRVQRQFTLGRHYYPLVCQVNVIDNGPGIPDALLKHIFCPMISGRAEGTGLGLAISQQLLRQHNGAIECQSRPGNTQFSIYLPLNDNKPSSARAHVIPTSPS